MNLLGYYDTKDNTGGQNTWLLKNGDDDREVQKYYKAENNDFLYAFTPQYNLQVFENQADYSVKKTATVLYELLTIQFKL